MCHGALKIVCYEDPIIKEFKQYAKEYYDLLDNIPAKDKLLIWDRAKRCDHFCKGNKDYYSYVKISSINNWTGEEDSTFELPLYMARNMAKQILQIEGETETGFRGAGIYFDSEGFSVTL